MSVMERLKTLVIEGNLAEAPKALQDALNAGVDLQQIIDQGLIAAMEVVGERFACGDLYIPEMILSARTMQNCLSALRPLIVGKGVKPKATVVFGTVQGDVHDIGKNLVIMMMQSAGFEVHDLGVNVAPEKFCETVHQLKPDLCCMSALLSTTQGAMRTTINLLKEKGVLAGVKVMVGGATISDSFASEIGADGYAPDAVAAIERARELLRLR
jgi:5-methyltetrahydrofolate--homocysteine methyltransferase